MGDAEVERFLTDQKRKCDQFVEGISSAFGDVMSETTGIRLSGYNVTDADRLEKYRGIARTSVVEGNVTEIRQCPPSFDGLLCWSPTDAPGTATLPCPPASIIGYTDLASDNLRALAVASKVCQANGEWYQNSDNVSWSNYSLCVQNSTGYIIEKNLNYSRWYETPAEFALLNKWLPIIRMVSHIGYVTSFTTLIVAMVIFSLLRKLRNPRNRLHMHLFASFIMRAFMALLKDWSFIDGIGLAWDVVFVDGKNVFIREHTTWICKVITSLWQYFIVANYSWILMEGLYLHNLVFLALCTDTSTIALYIVLGWGLPVLVVVPWIIIRVIIEDTLCWTTHDNSSLFLVIRIPIMVSILFNFLLFLNIVRVLLVKLKTSVHLQRKKMKYKRWAKSTLVLVPLFGIHYTFFLGLSYHKDYRVELVWLFCDQLFASFQGSFVAFLYCLLNGEVRAEMRRVWKARRSKREVDSFISGHTRNSKDGINRKRHRSEGDDGTNFVITMKKLSVKDIK
ncbi:vasoactive intestinal polypeptide receptor 2 [Monomorium pharaonis]|uniref:vasoactive intestinal polypeptide receptor 2 n=1 Tax=Monomorium pharaonis TaxID=307658 RepID=UPI00063FB5EF|nr:vasoactive intestinal polypeptide receptor 2 [Monomorium pharaonis]XP_036140237.1 vasoactive intestinal polypeptide receptor 2 [Monomorium pharaonis]